MHSLHVLDTDAKLVFGTGVQLGLRFNQMLCAREMATAYVTSWGFERSLSGSLKKEEASRLTCIGETQRRELPSVTKFNTGGMRAACDRDSWTGTAPAFGTLPRQKRNAHGGETARSGIVCVFPISTQVLGITIMKLKRLASTFTVL